jgi:PilZ domain
MEHKKNATGQTHEVEGIAGERRHNRRYEMQLDLRWKLIRRRRVLETGIGHTIDLSSNGIHIETDRPLPAGLNVELSIAWPAMLHNKAPLQLVVTGKVVRSEGLRAAIQKFQHEFRTAGIATDRRANNSTPSLPPTSLLAYSAAMGSVVKMR